MLNKCHPPISLHTKQIHSVNAGAFKGVFYRGVWKGLKTFNANRGILKDGAKMDGLFTYDY